MILSIAVVGNCAIFWVNCEWLHERSLSQKFLSITSCKIIPDTSVEIIKQKQRSSSAMSV